MRINPWLQGTFAPNSVNDLSKSLQNVKLNGLVFDFRFIPDALYLGIDKEGDSEEVRTKKAENRLKSKYRVLKNIVVSVNYRDGMGVGANALLIDRVNLFLLMEHSDFIAGLDITLSEMKEGKEWRACGHLGLGYLSVTENASLDIQCYVKVNPEISANLFVSTELRRRSNVDVVQYRETRPTGASQTYENVLSAFISTKEEMNDTISTSDYLSNEVINVESAIALSNSVGNFEKFKRYGQFYEDEFGVGQTLTFNCPLRNDDEEILLCCRVFNLSAQLAGDSEYQNDGKALMSKIATLDPNKFRALALMGQNLFGVSA